MKFILRFIIVWTIAWRVTGEFEEMLKEINKKDTK